MRAYRFMFVIAGFLLVNLAVWLMAVRYLRQQIFVGVSKPYASLVSTLSPMFPGDPGPRSRFVLTDWVFPKDAPVIGPNGETSASMTIDNRKVGVGIRKGNMYYHTPLSFEQVCSFYRQKPFVEEDRNAFEGIATDSNRHAVFVCYGSSYNVFLIVTKIPASPTTNVTINYRAIDSVGLPNP